MYVLLSNINMNFLCSVFTLSSDNVVCTIKIYRTADTESSDSLFVLVSAV